MLWMGMVIMNSQYRKGVLYQIVAFILAKPALLILVKLSTLVLAKLSTLILVKFTTLVLAKLATLMFRRPESGLRYNFEIDLFG